MQITEQQFKEKYGDIQVTFQSYYKYVFTYRGVIDEKRVLLLEFGGNSDDIYRHEVLGECSETMNSLEPFAGGVYDDGIMIEHFCSY